MKDFNKLEYKRLDYQKTKELIEREINNLKNAKTFIKFLEEFMYLISIQNDIEEYSDYIDIQNMRDNKNKFYAKEMEYWNEYKPKFDTLFKPFYDVVLKSKYKNKLKKYVPESFFNTIKYQNKLLQSGLESLYQKDNELKTKYRELLRGTTLYNGKGVSLNTITVDFQNSNREIRKNAHDTYNDYFHQHHDEFNDILYELVIVRNKIAKQLGMKSYKEYSLYQLKRFGYNYTHIRKFRNNIRKYILPICKEISAWQKEELGLKELQYYDTVCFKEMPKTKYQNQKFLDKMQKVFTSIDEEAGKLYSEMLDNNYIDAIPRDSKLMVGITNYLVKTKMPTITINFKGTEYDMSALTHEFGHSFQKYNASLEDEDYVVPALLKYPTFDIAEMFSHAMELVSCSKVKDMFIDNDYKKYSFLELRRFITMMPYIALVDEFQEQIYTKENLQKEDICNIWLKLCKKYKQTTSNSGNPNLDAGGYLYRQTHLYLNPFYFIDYGISYFGAFSIWKKCQNDMKLFKDSARVASYYSLNELINKFDFSNPFDEQSFSELADFLYKEIKNKKQ